MELRQTGKTSLAKFTTKVKAKQLEDALHLITKGDEDAYKTALYQLLFDLQEKKKPATLLAEIKKKETLWNHPDFAEMVHKLAERNNFLENPFEVAEGMFECKAIDKATGTVCGSRRVYSYSRQQRSADEGMTTFCQCCDCNASWSHRG